MKKKLLSIVLAGILLALTIPAPGFAVEEDSSGRAQAVCVNLGLIDAASAKADSMTRAQFAKMVSNIYSKDTTDYGNMAYFTDVAAGTSDAAAVNKLAAYGLVRGDGASQFFPNNAITMEEAAAILIRLLGYEKVTPAGQYLAKAGSLGLLKGASSAKPVAAQLVTMVYNALETDVMEQIQYGVNTDYNVVKGKTILNAVLNMEQYTGVVQSANGVSLYPEVRTDKAYVRIGEVQFALDAETNLAVFDMIGLSVTAYYKTDEENTLLFCLENQRASTITVNLENLISVESDGITYYDEAEKKCTEKFSGSPNILYNNRYADHLPDLSQSGYIRLIDNGNGIETMIVKDYHVTVANAVSAKNAVITDKIGAQVIDLDINSEHYSIRNTAGAEIGLDAIKEWNVLSVAKSVEGDFTEIIVSDQSAQGTVDRIEEGAEADTYRVAVSGSDYRLTKEYYAYMKNGHELKLGMEGTFYLDKDGRIAAYNPAAVSTVWKVGYLIKTAMETNLSTELQAKILTADGTILKTGVKTRNGRILVDEELVTVQAFLAAYEDANQFIRKVIRYKLDSDGKVSELDMPSENKNDIGLRHLGKLSSVDYFSSSRSFNNQIIISPDTVVFTVPSKKEKYDDDASYKISKMSIYSNRNQYSPDIYAYSDGMQGEVIVRTVDLKTELLYSTNMSMVKSFGMALNSDGDSVQKLYEIKDGKEASVIGTAEADLKHTNYNPNQTKSPGTTATTYTVEEGDVIRHGISNGEADFVQLLYDRSEDKYLPTDNPTAKNQSNNGQYRAGIGTVVKIDGNLVKFRFRGSGAEEYYLTDKAKYAVYDEKEEPHVQVGELTDIRDLENYPDNPSIVVVHIKYGELTDVMIYN